MIEIDVQRGKSNPTKKVIFSHIGSINYTHSCISQVYVPGISRKLKDGEFLDYDSMAYRVFHKFETGMSYAYAFVYLSFSNQRFNLVIIFSISMFKF